MYFHKEKLYTVQIVWFFFFNFFFFKKQTHKGHDPYIVWSNIGCARVPVSSTGKISYGCIRDLEFNPRPHQKLISVLVWWKRAIIRSGRHRLKLSIKKKGCALILRVYCVVSVLGFSHEKSRKCSCSQALCEQRERLWEKKISSKILIRRLPAMQS